MEHSQGIGKFIVIIGLMLVVVGLIVMYSSRIPFLGKLPGDISIKKENVSFYFPLTTSIVLSILLSLVLYLIRRFQ